MRANRHGSWALALAAAFSTAPALAYPSSTVYAPNGAVLEQGRADVSISRIVTNGPRGAALSDTWIGAQIGVTSGLTSAGGPGAIEIGADAIVPTDPSASTAIVFNAKVGVHAETRRAPAIAAGVFQASPSDRANALLGYVVADKHVHVWGRSIGRVTAGGVVALGGTGDAFRGGPPFRGTPFGVLAGWESPALYGVTASADLVSGSSLASGANVGIAADLSADASIHAALSFATDRRADVHQGDAVVFGFTIRLDAASRAP